MTIPQKTTVSRNELGHFLKGTTSPNPGGRPPMSREIKNALTAAAPKAVSTLIKIMNDKNEETVHRLKAVEILLNRLFGKPSSNATNAFMIIRPDTDISIPIADDLSFLSECEETECED